MRIGTSHFVSRRHAIRYYKDYHYENTAEAVDRKLSEGEIHIGPPKIQKTEHLELIDNGCRYCRVDNK